MKKYLLLTYLLLSALLSFGQAKLTADSTAGSNLQASPSLQWSRNLLYGKPLYYFYDAKTGKTLPFYPAQLTNYIFLSKDEAANLYQPKGGSSAETDPTVPAYAKTLTGFSVIKSATDPLYLGLHSTADNSNQLGTHPASYYYPASNPNSYISSFTEADPTVPSYTKTLTSFSAIKSSTDPLYLQGITGDISVPNGGGFQQATLPTVNANPGTLGSASSTLTVQSDGKGRILSMSSQPIQIAASQVTGLSNAYVPYMGANGPVNIGNNAFTSAATISGGILYSGNQVTAQGYIQANSYLQQGNVLGSMLKTNASGILIAATAGTDYVAPATLNSYVPYVGAFNDLNLGNKNAIAKIGLFGTFTSSQAIITDFAGNYNNTGFGIYNNTVTYGTTNYIFGSLFGNTLINSPGGNIQLSYAGTPVANFGYGGGNVVGSWTVSTFLKQGNVTSSILKADASGILVAATAGTDYVSPTSSYANPSWLTSFAYSKVTGAPVNVSAFANDAGYVSINNTISNINGSAGGNIAASMPFRAAGYKKVIIYLTSLNGSATYNFPIGFTQQPQITTSSLDGETSTATISTTSCIISTNTAFSGAIILEGY